MEKTLNLEYIFYGGSYAVDIPKEFVRNIDTKEVILVVVSNEIHIHPKTELDTIESEPQFAQFICALSMGTSLII